MTRQWLTHSNTTFEGYYTRFNLPSGASIALVICWVPKAQRKPYMVSLTYLSITGSFSQHELWVPKIYNRHTGPDSFEIVIPGTGYMKSSPQGTEYYIRDEQAGISFHANTTSRTPWSAKNPTSSPEGWIAHLPLPMHWYVHSLASNSTFSLGLPKASIPAIDTAGNALVHMEKNWANSFPNAHVWIQAHDPTNGSSVCAAGGTVLGMTAFLAGYRSKTMDVDFKPPFALSMMGLAPFMSLDVNWNKRTVKLAISGLRKKLVILATAPEGSFFTLSSPFAEGHRENYLAQSFRASVDVFVFGRWGGWGWKVRRRERFEGASLEFGGGYYPCAGTGVRVH